jgi:hypothetical protein
VLKVWISVATWSSSLRICTLSGRTGAVTRGWPAATIAHNCRLPSLIRTNLTLVIRPETRRRIHWTKVLVYTLVWTGLLLFCSLCSDVSEAGGGFKAPERRRILVGITLENIGFTALTQQLNTLSCRVNFFPIPSAMVCRYERIPCVWRWGKDSTRRWRFPRIDNRSARDCPACSRSPPRTLWNGSTATLRVSQLRLLIAAQSPSRCPASS